MGLAQFRRDLKKIDESLSKEVTKYLRAMARKTQREAKTLAPVGKPYIRKGKQHRPGTLRNSIRYSATQRQMSLYSNNEYAPAHEWGTTGQGDSRVQPRGVPIKIRRRQMLGKAVVSRIPEMEQELLDMVDHLAQVNGFND